VWTPQRLQRSQRSEKLRKRTKKIRTSEGRGQEANPKGTRESEKQTKKSNEPLGDWGGRKEWKIASFLKKKA